MYICTTRFNNKTYIENLQWKMENSFYGCIYGSPHRISINIAPYKKLIVIEMNNTTNQIMGIGCIENYVITKKKYIVYKEHKYNRYIYKGNYWIGRQNIDELVLDQLEYILFKTSSHDKRLRGITRVSVHKLGYIIDDVFYIGDKVKKIKDNHSGIIGTVIDKKGSKVKVGYNINNTSNVWSFRYALGNYVKVNEIKKKAKCKGKYKCRLCGEIKRNHHCLVLKYDKKTKDYVYNYLLNVFSI